MSIRYYVRPNGDCPPREWLDGLDASQRQNITAKLRSLEIHGVLLLLGTSMLERLVDVGSDLYQLRGGQCRIVFYYDRTQETCWLLHDFLKKSRRATKDIETARSLLGELLAGGDIK